MSSSGCLPIDKLNAYNLQLKTKTLHEVEKYVLLTIILFSSLFFLNGLKKRFAKFWLKLLSWVCYILVPILITYSMGLMAQPKNSVGGGKMFNGLYAIWAIFLLFPYAGFDTLTAFSLDERNGRSRLLLQFFIQFFLSLFLVYWRWSDLKTKVIPILFVFLVLLLKMVERVAALAHSAGATPGVRENLRKMINYMNEEEEEEGVDPISMRGFKYLVGPRYLTMKDNKIVDGISIDKIWRCNGKLLSSELGGGDVDGKLKDTCLSFALFWLLLGKFWGYPLYEGNDSRMKGWKLVCDGLLGGGVDHHERVFRVIEVELGFLRDYFYSKYMFFYLNGFYWKLYLLAFPLMFWWFTFKSIDYEEFNAFYLKHDGYDPKINFKATATITLIMFALEVIQLGILVASKWFTVTLLSFYAKREMSKNRASFLDCCFDKVIGSICRLSLSPRKLWKREMDQYSLLKSCTSLGIENNSVQAFGVVLGIQLPKVGRAQSTSVVLSEDVKKAIAVSLQTNCPRLSNGIACLRRNEMEEKLSWACKLKTNAETILVWHIATSICEMNPATQEDQVPLGDLVVATSLSKYCAYLLVFAPTLLPVSLLEADSMCDIAIREARELFKKPPGQLCRKAEKVNKYEKLMEFSSDIKGVEGQRATSLQKGVKLGKELVFAVRDEKRRWKILAEFWAEMILFLAPSNNNEMAHAEKLAVGGEFITHLWALLIHAGIQD